MTNAVLIPIGCLDGFDVWIGNHLAGSFWNDRWGWRWSVTWHPPNRFIFGECDNQDAAIKSIIDNFRPV